MATGARILGDFSNATITNRTLLQTSSTNLPSFISVIPNGTSTSTSFTIENNSAPGNSSFGSMFINTTAVTVSSGIRGSGTLLPLFLFTGSTPAEGIGIDTSNNVTLGNDFILGGVGSSQRFQADFTSGISGGNLVGTALKTTTLDGNTNVYVIPNGTATSTSISLENTPGPFTNRSGFAVSASLVENLIAGVKRGVSTLFPIRIKQDTVLSFEVSANGDIILGNSAQKIGFFSSTGAVRATAASMTTLPALVTYLQSLGLLS